MALFGSFLTEVVGGIQYYVHPQPVGTVSTRVLTRTGRPIPTVLLSPQDGESSSDTLLELLQKFKDIDDVYSDAFNATLILQKLDYILDEPLQRAWPDYIFKNVLLSDIKSSAEELPSGPYFLIGQSIHQAWRLYDDELDAFIISVIPEELKPTNKRFQALGQLSNNSLWKQVAVPSRLYHQPTPLKPLAGKRVSIKDVFDLAGTVTTLSSRDFAALYDVREDNADYVQKLISLGVVIVGKTKTTSFASSDEPTDQWVDFHCPTNPRGDKYQSPSGSTTGGAAALAGYSWLDASIGTDTAGSIRAPATSNGLFSLRPSFGMTSMKGTQANCPNFDVVGVLERSLQSLHLTVSSTLPLHDSHQFPSRITYPKDFFPHSVPNQQAMVDEFVSILEAYLGVERTEVSIIEEWKKSPPKEANGKSLKKYLAKSAFWPMCHDYYHLYDEYREDFEAKFDRRPYVGPVVEYRWDVGRATSQVEADQGWAEQQVFRTWFEANIMSSHSRTMSDAVMIMPYGSGHPKYRDAPNEAPLEPSSSHTLGQKFMSPVLQLPQLVIPIGQSAYDSKVTGREEYRPIATTLMGAKGSDLMLLNLAKAALSSAAWPTEVLTGRNVFRLGNNTRNVAEIRPSGTV